MRCSVILLLAVGMSLAAQDLSKYGVGPVGYGYTFPVPVYAAPGQLLTLSAVITDGDPGQGVIHSPGGADLPTTLAGISLKWDQGVHSFPPLPIFEVRTFCSTLTPKGFVCQNNPLAAVTVQVPMEAPDCRECSTFGTGPSGTIALYTSGGSVSEIDFTVLPDQVHILTSCDSFLPSPSVYDSATGLPCPSLVTHADGSLVSASSPAIVGEELIAYAVGLGQTNPALTTGKLVKAAVPTLTTFGLDFNFRSNTLPTKPPPSAPPPVYAGATPGFVGLYQVNFVVPPVPSGTPSCYVPPPLVFVTPPFQNVVESNLTVSVGGLSSFDGARICVTVPTP